LIRAVVETVALRIQSLSLWRSMKIRTTWPLYLLLLVFAVLGIRLAWTLSVSTTGWKPHLDQWSKVAASLVGIHKTPLSDKTPKAQAEFWLEQVSQVESADDDPQVAMGAAWMLDAPQFRFVRRHVRVKEDLDFPGIPASWRRELDDEAIAAMTEEFESLCRDECLAKIETAVRLDGANVELWRGRALLLFQTKFMSLDMEPRRDDWFSVLDECSEHDPDNALYDYLAALHLWSSSAEYDWKEDGYILKIEDGETFKEGTARLTAGLAKPHLKFGTRGYAATMDYLDESSLPLSDHLNAAGSRQIDYRAASLLYRIMRWQSVRLDVEKRMETFDATNAVVRNVLRISDQVLEAGNYPNLSTPKLILRQWGLANLKDMHEDHPNLLSVDVAEKVCAELAEVQLDLEVLQEVRKRLAAKAGTSIGTDRSSGAILTITNHLFAVLLMVTAQMLVIVTLGLSLLSGLAAWVLGAATNGERIEMRWLRHVVAWLGGVGVSFVLLGMCPAKVISPSVQTWLLCGLVWIGYALLAMGVLHLVRKQLQVPWAQLVVLAAITALPVVLVLHHSAIIDLVVTAIANLHPSVLITVLLVSAWLCGVLFHVLLAFARNDVLARRRKFLACGLVFLLALIAVPAGTALAVAMSDELEAQAWISPAVWREAEGLHITPSEIQSAVKLEDSKWGWAFIQWQAHHGPIAAPLIVVGVLLIWHLILRARRFEGGYRKILRSQKRGQIRLAGNVVARSCVVASLVFSLVYLGATPTVAESMETYHRVHYERLVNPSQTWEEIAAASAQIKSDESLMTRLKAEIAERNRQISEQESWLEE